MSHVATTTERALTGPRTRAQPFLLLRLALLAAGAALLAGCIILDLDGTAPGANAGSGANASSGANAGSGSDMGSGSSMGMSPPLVQRLPAPAIPRVDLPVLDAAAQKRLDEVEQYLWEQYQAAGWQIEGTTQGFFGDIYDWLKVASVKGAQVEPPPKPTPEEMQLPDGVQLSLTELDVFPELRGPPGTIPVVRPSFAAYVMGLSGASSLDDFLGKYAVPGDPSGQDRLYAGIVSQTPNQGASTWINSFNGLIDFNTMSLLEMAVGCRNLATNEMWQQVGIAVTKDWVNTPFVNFGDSVLRIQVEFLTLGHEWRGKGKGGWEGSVSVGDFKPAEGALYAPGMAIVNPSTIGGPQFESSFHIKLWNGDWWVGWNGSWLGYYPGKLFGDEFSSMLVSNACQVLWYGEVYDPSYTTTQWTTTDLGSGQCASAGWGNAASFRNPTYIDLSGMPQWPSSDPDVTKDVGPHNDACYTKTQLSIGQPPWDRWFYVGGPGGDAPKGDCPAPP